MNHDANKWKKYKQILFLEQFVPNFSHLPHSDTLRQNIFWNCIEISISLNCMFQHFFKFFFQVYKVFLNRLEWVFKRHFAQMCKNTLRQNIFLKLHWDLYLTALYVSTFLVSFSFKFTNFFKKIKWVFKRYFAPMCKNMR